LVGQEFPNLLAANRVTTVAYYEMGEARTFHFINSSTKTKNDKPKPDEEEIIEYDVELTVLEQEDSSYIMEMVYTNFVFPETKRDNELNEAIAQLSEGLKIRYITDELGRYDSIVNKDELAKDLKLQIEEVIAHFDGKFEKEEEKVFFSTMMNFLTEKLTLPENIEALYAEDILKIHGYYGIELTVGKPIEIELEYSTLNNFVLAGTGTITLNTVNKDADAFTFMTTEAPNKEEMNSYLKELFAFFVMENIKEKISLSEFKFSSKAKSKFTLELSTGWLKSATHTSTNTFAFGKDTVKMVKKSVIKEKR
jgi:hypothetical protein